MDIIQAPIPVRFALPELIPPAESPNVNHAEKGKTPTKELPAATRSTVIRVTDIIQAPRLVQPALPEHIPPAENPNAYHAEQDNFPTPKRPVVSNAKQT